MDDISELIAKVGFPVVAYFLIYLDLRRKIEELIVIMRNHVAVKLL